MEQQRVEGLRVAMDRVNGTWVGWMLNGGLVTGWGVEGQWHGGAMMQPTNSTDLSGRMAKDANAWRLAFLVFPCAVTFGRRCIRLQSHVSRRLQR